MKCDGLNERNQLDSCWVFSDLYKTCSIESANDSFEIIKSRSYYGRINDLLVFAFPENWRQLENYHKNRPFSFYVDNLIEAETLPEIYSRLQVWGELTLYCKGSVEFGRFLPVWRRTWEDFLPSGNLMIPEYAAIFKPYRFELNERHGREAGSYNNPLSYPDSLVFNLVSNDFDEDGHYYVEAGIGT